MSLLSVFITSGHCPNLQSGQEIYTSIKLQIVPQKWKKHFLRHTVEWMFNCWTLFSQKFPVSSCSKIVKWMKFSEFVFLLQTGIWQYLDHYCMFQSGHQDLSGHGYWLSTYLQVGTGCPKKSYDATIWKWKLSKAILVKSQSCPTKLVGHWTLVLVSQSR